MGSLTGAAAAARARRLRRRGRRSGRPGGRPRGGQGLLHHERRRRRAGHAQRRRAHHRHAHARLLRRLPLRVLGPLDQGRGRHQGARRERTVDADPATTVPYKFSDYAIVGMLERRVRDLRRRGRRHAVRVQLNFEVTDTSATFSVQLRRARAPPSGSPTRPSSTGSSSAPTRRCESHQRERHRPPAGGVTRRPGARLGARPALGHGDHRAGRQRAMKVDPSAGVHVRRGPHPVPGGGPRQGAAAAAAPSWPRRWPRRRSSPTRRTARVVGARQGRPVGRSRRRRACGRALPGRRDAVLPLRPRAEDPVPGAVPARLPGAASCRRRWPRSSGAWAAWAATTSPPRCSTS